MKKTWIIAALSTGGEMRISRPRGNKYRAVMRWPDKEIETVDADTLERSMQFLNHALLRDAADKIDK